MSADDQPRSNDDFLGAELGGRYRIVEPLGKGGMAKVYLAEDLNLRGHVAVKRPLLKEIQRARQVSEDQLWDPEELCRRFREEIEQLLSTRHQAIVRILARGDHGDTPYYVLEHMDRGSLDDRLKSPQSPREVLTWLKPIARALDYIHGLRDRKGMPTIVHRDVKPSNILFCSDGDGERVCLSDFGIVKVLGEEAAIRTLNTTIGTYAFMAPEQSDPDAIIDGRVDQYALGATAYRALTGKDVFYDVPVLERPGAKRLRDPIRVDAEGMAPHLPKGAADAVMKALSRSRDDRFRTCEAFAEEFERGLRPETEVNGTAEAGGRPTEVLREGEAAATAPPRSRWILALLLVGVLLVAAGYLAGVFDLGDRAGRQVGEVLDGKPPRAFKALAVEADRLAGEGMVREAKAKATEARALGAKDSDFERATLEAIADFDAPPEIAWTQPGDGATVGEPTVRVKGTVRKARQTDRVLVNGQEMRRGPGTFEEQLSLPSEGAQRLELTVEDGGEARLQNPVVRVVAYVASWRGLAQQASVCALSGDWDEAERLVDEAKAKGAKDADLPDALRRGLEPPDLSIDGTSVDGSIARLTVTLKTNRAVETVASSGRILMKAAGTFEIDVPVTGTGKQTVKVAVVRRGEEAVARTTTVEAVPPADEKPSERVAATAAGTLRAELTAPASVAVGEEFDIFYAVTNTGKTTVGCIELAEDLPGGLVTLAGTGEVRIPVEKLLPSERRETKIRCRAAKGGDFTLVAAAQAGEVSARSETRALRVRCPKLALTLFGYEGKAGVPLKYLAVVRNEGDAPASDVTFEWKLPESAQVVQGSDEMDKAGTVAVGDYWATGRYLRFDAGAVDVLVSCRSSASDEVTARRRAVIAAPESGNPGPLRKSSEFARGIQRLVADANSDFARTREEARLDLGRGMSWYVSTVVLPGLSNGIVHVEADSPFKPFVSFDYYLGDSASEAESSYRELVEATGAALGLRADPNEEDGSRNTLFRGSGVFASVTEDWGKRPIHVFLMLQAEP